jgi:hypothetical protein
MAAGYETLQRYLRRLAKGGMCLPTRGAALEPAARMANGSRRRTWCIPADAGGILRERALAFEQTRATFRTI